jgi:hypothetical protein
MEMLSHYEGATDSQSDSDSSEGDHDRGAVKRQKRTHVESHEGRHRQFAHVDGNWATFAYIPIEQTAR